jgi:single-strand DNA-binding protein
MSVNKVLILGNLGADPDLRYTPSQVPVCNLRIATNERRRNAQGEWDDHTEWHSVVAFNKQAENCNQYLSKGRQVFVEGRLQTRKWQDKDGNDRYSTEIVAANVQFVGGRGDSPGVGRSQGAAAPMDDPSMAPELGAAVSFDDDDIPF